MGKPKLTTVLEAANLYAPRKDGTPFESIEDVPVQNLERLLLVLKIQREIYNIERRDGLERACMVWEFAISNMEVRKRMTEHPTIAKQGVAQYDKQMKKTYSSISKPNLAELGLGADSNDE